MFQSAYPLRKLIVAGALGVGLLCAGPGGAAWYFTRCDMADYLGQAKAYTPNPREQYLFACGRVWHSLDGGRVWARVPAQGLPFGLRDAQIGVDRRPGLLYLGVLMNVPLSLNCLTCAWVKIQPAIYVSLDGGVHWSLAHPFTPGSASNTHFVAVHADPDYESAAWIILKRGDEIAYYGTNTAGRVWQKTCVEDNLASLHCDPPDDLLSFRHDRARSRGAENP